MGVNQGIISFIDELTGVHFYIKIPHLARSTAFGQFQMWALATGAFGAEKEGLT